MLVCDRCSKPAIHSMQNIMGKVQGSAIQLYEKVVDLCDRCTTELKNTICKFMEPLPSKKV